MGEMTAVERGVSRRERLADYQAARRRAADYLLAHMRADGAIGPVDRGVITYYRLPWALALVGECEAAQRNLAWIASHALSDEGEFRGPVPLAPDANRTTNTYAETCLAYGAWLLRRFDLARRAMTFALRYQDPVTGGVFMDRQRTGPDGPQVLYLTCQLGMSAVITGHKPAAEAAGRWLCRLWDAQPALSARLYTIATGRGLVTRPPANEDARHYINESQEVRQFHYNGGIAAAFLTQLAMATGDDTWLNYAGAFQCFSMASTPRQFEVKQVCKSAWGSGLLSLATGDPVYTQWAERMGDWFVAEQFPDGHWQNSTYIDPDPPLERNIEITAEFLVHLDTVIAALAAAE